MELAPNPHYTGSS